MPTKKGNKAIVIYYSPEEWRTVCKKAKTARLRNGTSHIPYREKLYLD